MATSRAHRRNNQDHSSLVRRLADDFGCTVDEVNSLLDPHPIEVDRNKYLKRVLALQLLQLDEIEEAFHDKAIKHRDVTSGVLLIKAQERRATLLGMNAPLGHSVRRTARAGAPADFDRPHRSRARRAHGPAAVAERPGRAALKAAARYSGLDPTTRELHPASVNQARLSAVAEVPTALLALEVQHGGMPGVPGRVMAARSVS